MANALQAALLVVTLGLLAVGGYAINVFFGLVGVALLLGLTVVFALGFTYLFTGSVPVPSRGGGGTSNAHRSKGARRKEE